MRCLPFHLGAHGGLRVVAADKSPLLCSIRSCSNPILSINVPPERRVIPGLHKRECGRYPPKQSPGLVIRSFPNLFKFSPLRYPGASAPPRARCVLHVAPYGISFGSLVNHHLRRQRVTRIGSSDVPVPLGAIHLDPLDHDPTYVAGVGDPLQSAKFK